ncbi:hypothetical protein BVC80_8851g6 [Macleaya cordata]|uniref:Uncharacterized protein n=1 Tax=Macleaya cordata TaxID=56857 RepID=A0A200PXW5_MACCD|nr:hypothetical protein BVC80_8851g6 [Macleaya cordata]
MALEVTTGFQVSTISTVRASMLAQNLPFLISKEKLNFPVCRGLKSTNLSHPATTSSFSRSGNPKCRTSSIVCKAREAVNEGMDYLSLSL